MSRASRRSAPPLTWRQGSRRFATRLVGLVGALAGFLVAPDAGRAWDAAGHRAVSLYAARIAVAGAPDIPDFFLLGGERIADASVGPDVRRNRGLAQLRSTESPEHYIDQELLDGSALPDSRYDYLRLLAEKELTPQRVGTVPYAIIEAMQQLTLAFAEHRARPEDDFIRAQILYHAGVLSHYAADMSQPLHTTIHHDGRARPDMSSPGTGIHQLVDSLIGRILPELTPPDDERWPRPLPEAWPAVLAQLADSHALVDRVYDLEGSLDWEDEAPAAVAGFTSRRMAAAVAFTARLFATAWVDSAHIELPDWRFDSLQPAAR